MPPDDEADDVHANDGVDEPRSTTPEVEPTQAVKPSRATSSMSQQQRDELIAEILGDVLVLAEKVNGLSTQISAIAQAVTANDFVRWRNTLDLKMTELAEINLSQQAATRLQAIASTWVDHLSKETNTLVRLEVKRAVNDTMTFNRLFDKLHRDWLLRISSVAVVVFASTLLAHLVWSWFRG